MNTTQKLNLKFFPYTQRGKNKQNPLYCMITIDSVRAQFSSPFKIDPKQWDKKNQKLNGVGPQVLIINNYIQQVRSELQSIFLKYLANDEIVSAKQLKAKYLGLDVQKPINKTLGDAFDYHILKLNEKVKAGLINRKTMLRYMATKSKIQKFIKLHMHQTDINLDDLKFSFISEFEHYLLTKDGLQSNTAHKNLINLKKVVKVAVELEWLVKSPFSNFKCSYNNPERVFLTLDEVEKIRGKQFKIKRLEEVRDVFIFQCYTGFAYTDLYGFDRNTLSIGIDGEFWITTQRKKTGNRESVPLLPVALEILEKYKFHPTCVEQNRLLPVNSNQKYNAYLQEIADLCGIRKKITTHVARHTFATTITLSNGVPIETVSKMLGHTKLATTQIYAKVLDRKVSEDMHALKLKLAANGNKSIQNKQNVI